MKNEEDCVIEDEVEIQGINEISVVENVQKKKKGKCMP